MMLPPRLRKTVLVVHVATSVGWLGALAAYLALDITVVTNADVLTVRSTYVAMSLVVRYAIVPLALASVLVGIINALGTPWGLFRHYWIVVKLVLTVVAAGVLLIEARSIDVLADIATTTSDPRQLGGSLPHSIGGTIILLTTLVLSVFKPRGLTPHGWRAQQRSRSAVETRV